MYSKTVTHIPTTYLHVFYITIKLKIYMIKYILIYTVDVCKIINFCKICTNIQNAHLNFFLSNI